MAKRIDSITLAGGLLGVKIFTTSGSYIPAANVKKFIVEMVGGGGGSVTPPAPDPNTQPIFLGSGGGAGGYAKFMVDVSALNGTLNLVVGAPGAQGSKGGQSRVEIVGSSTTILATASGGSAGLKWTGTTVPAMVGGGGGGSVYLNSSRVTTLVRCDGEKGGVGSFLTKSLGYGGRGGSNPMGCGASEAIEGISGGKGYGPGGGASGVARRARNGTPISGGVGGSGLIIISEYE